MSCVVGKSASVVLGRIITKQLRNDSLLETASDYSRNYVSVHSECAQMRQT